MNKTILVIIILLLSIAFIYLKGEFDIKKAQRNYISIGFENSSQEISIGGKEFQALNFFINNQKKGKMQRKIEFFVEKEKIDEIEVGIDSKDKKTIEPTQRIIDFLDKLDQKESIQYSVNIINGNKKETIKKEISISDF